MLSIEDPSTLRGRPLIASDGDEIGGIVEIYCDKATREPEWFGINAGIMGTKRIVVPVEGATVEADGVHVPYTSDMVKDAPGVDSRELTEDAESELYTYYGIAFSRAASPTILPVPAFSADEPAGPYDGGAIDAMNGAGPALVPASLEPVAPGGFDSVSGGVSTAEARKPWSPASEPLPDQQSADSARGRLRGFAKDLPVRRALQGAAAGAAATLPMTAAMFALQRLLPKSDQQALPPRQIMMNAAKRVGADPRRMDESSKQALTTLSHYGFGAASGAGYAVLVGKRNIHPVVGGAVYGAGLWAVSYLGWLPALGLTKKASRESRGRAAVMFGANVLWGIGAATMARRLETGMDQTRKS